MDRALEALQSRLDGLALVAAPALAAHAPDIGAAVLESKGLAGDVLTLVASDLERHHHALAVSLFFRPDKGALAFLKAARANRDHDGAKVALCSALASLIGQVGLDAVQSHLAEIVSVCTALFNSRETAKVRLASLEPLMRILEFERPDVAAAIGVEGIFNLYFSALVQQASKLTASVKGAILRMLGLLCRVHPTSVSDRQRAQLRRLLLQAIETLFSTKKDAEIEMQLVVGAMTGINSLLAVENMPTEQDTLLVFNATKHVVQPIDDLNRYDLPKAGLQLLIDNCRVFEPYLLRDSTLLFGHLDRMSAHKNRDLSRLGHRALREFLKRLVSIILLNPNGAREREAFSTILGRLHSKIDNAESSVREVSLSISALGFFSRVCKARGEASELAALRAAIIRRSVQFYENTASIDEEHLSHIHSFLIAFMHLCTVLDTVDAEVVHAIQRVTEIMIAYFPSIGSVNRWCAPALLDLLWTLRDSPNWVSAIWHHTAFQAIIFTSTDILPTARGPLIESTGVTSEQAYKEYMPFWNGVFDPKNISLDVRNGADDAQIEAFFDMLYDHFIECMLLIPRNLNLTMTQLPDQPPAAGTEGGSDRRIMPSLSQFSAHLSPRAAAEAQPDAAASVAEPPTAASLSDGSKLSAENPKDFRILANFVEFARHFLLGPQKKRLVRWMHPAGEAWIRLSNDHPLVSGFYSLMAICLRVSADLRLFDPSGDFHRRAECTDLFRSHIQAVIVRMQPFKDELLASCLSLVLAAPPELVEVGKLGGCMRTALKQGLSYPPLAVVALDAMDRWIASFSRETLSAVFPDILPPLIEYLTSEIVAAPVDANQDADVARRVAFSIANLRRRRFRNMRLTAANDPAELKSIQDRIVDILGRVGGDNRLALAEVDPDAKVSWSRERGETLQFDIPFKDMLVRVSFDDILPRLCHLAEFAAERQTKVHACELLHALIVLMLGRSAFGAASDTKSKFYHIYEKVFPAMCRLSVDTDNVTRELFRPLTLQTVRWLTRIPKAENHGAVIMLTACVDAATSDNGHLRDFGAECIAEFLRYSIKHSALPGMAAASSDAVPAGAVSVFRRIAMLCQHHSAQKRMGACAIVNRIYRIFREEDALVLRFTMETLFNLLIALRIADADSPSLGSVDLACKAIEHMSDIVLRRPDPFYKGIPKFKPFAVCDRPDMFLHAEWLLKQTNRREVAFARTCFGLFRIFASLIDREMACSACLDVWSEQLTRGVRDNSASVDDMPRRVFHKIAEGDPGLLVRLLAVPRIGEPGVALGSVPLPLAEQFAAAMNAALMLLKFSILDAAAEGVVSALEPSLARLFGLCAQLESASDLSHAVSQNAKCKDKLAMAIANTFEIVDLLVRGGHPVPYHRAGERWSLGGVVPAETFMLVLIKAILEPSVLALDGYGDGIASSDIARLLRSTASSLFTCLDDQERALFADMAASRIDPRVLTLDALNDTHGLARSRTLFEGLAMLAATPWLDVLVSRGVLAPLDAGLERIRSDAIGGDPDTTVVAGACVSLSMGIESHRNFVCTQMLRLFDHAPSASAAKFYRRFQTALLTNAAQIDIAMAMSLEDFLGVLAPNWIGAQAQMVFMGMLETLQSNSNLYKRAVRRLCKSLDSAVPALQQLFGLRDIQNTNAVRAIFEKLCHVAGDALRTGGPFSKVMADEFLYLIDPTFSLAEKRRTIQLIVGFSHMDADTEAKVADVIERTVSQQFAIAPSDMNAFRGSELFAQYTGFVRGILYGIEVIGSGAIAQKLFVHLCRDSESIFTHQTQSRMFKMGCSLDEHKLLPFLGICMQMLKDGSLKTSIRGNVIRDAAIPVLQGAPESLLVDFFVEHIEYLTDQIKKPLTSRVEELKTELTIKSACFSLVEVAYQRLPTSLVHDAGSEIVARVAGKSRPDGKEMTLAVTKAAHAAKSERAPPGEPAELAPLRLHYHISAYAALSAVICKTQSKALVVCDEFTDYDDPPSENLRLQIKMFTTFLFMENTIKGELHWDNLVDLKAEIKDIVQFSARSNRERFQDLVLPAAARNVRYMSSVYLRDSSLSQNPWVGLGPAAAPARRATDAAGDPMEVDAGEPAADGDESKAVDPSFGVLSQNVGTWRTPVDGETSASHNLPLPHQRSVAYIVMRTLEIAKSITADGAAVPALVAEIAAKLSPDTAFHIRVFLAKLIMSKPDFFFEYRQQLWRPFTILLAQEDLYHDGMSTLSQEIMIQLVLWSSKEDGTLEAVFDLGPGDRNVVLAMMHALCANATAHTRSGIAGHVKLIRKLIECFNQHKLVVAPTRVLYEHLTSHDAPEKNRPLTAVYLASAFVTNHLLLYSHEGIGLAQVSEGRLLESITALFDRPRKEVFATAAELVGQLLNEFKNSPNPNAAMFDYLVRDALKQLNKINPNTGDTDKFVVIVNRISSQYADFARHKASTLLYVLPRLYGSPRAMCLEALAFCAADVPDMFAELRANGLLGLLSHRDEESQTCVLAILARIAFKLTPENVGFFFDAMVEAFPSHPSERCRRAYYTLVAELTTRFVGLHDKVRSAIRRGTTASLDEPDLGRVDEELVARIAAIRDRLRLCQLSGFADSEDTIREGLVKYVNDRMFERTTLFQRTEIIFKSLYSPDTEETFMQFASHFILDAAKQSANIDSRIIEGDLAKVRFVDAKIDTTWIRNTAMMPLFASPPQSLAGMQASTEMLEIDSNGLRQTQAPMWTPTPDKSSSAWRSTFTFTETQLDLTVPRKYDSNSTGQPRSGMAATYESLRALKRLPSKPGRNNSLYFAGEAIRIKKSIHQAQRLQREARARQVALTRQYREGELPDVSIKNIDIIRPLQILTQRDTEISKMMFAKLTVEILLRIRENNMVMATGGGGSTGGSRSSGSGGGASAMASASVHPSASASGNGSLGSLASVDGIGDPITLVQNIFAISRFSSSPFIGAMLEVLHRVGETHIDPQLIAAASAKTGNEQIGALVLEHAVDPSAGEPVQGNRAETWVAISQLYKSMGDTTVFQSIYDSHIDISSATQDAIHETAAGDYEEAKNLYFDNVKTSMMLEHEGLIWESMIVECYNKLFQWDQLASHIDDAMGNPLHLVDHGLHSTMIEPFIRAQLHVSLEMPEPRLDALLRPEGALQREYLEANHSLELGVASLIVEDYSRARHFASLATRDFVDRFASLGQFSRAKKLRMLSSLQMLSELREGVAALEKRITLGTLLQTWNKRLPSESDDVDIWADILLVREAALMKWPRTAADDANAIATSKEQLIVAAARAAQSQSNFELAISLIARLENQDARAFNPTFLLEGVRLNVSQIRNTRADVEERSRSFSAIMTNLHKFQSNIDAMPEALRIQFVEAEAEACSLMLPYVIEKSSEYFTPLTTTKGLMRVFTARGLGQPDTGSTLADAINRIAFNCFAEARDSMESDEIKVRARQMLALQCDQVLRWHESGDQSVEPLNVDLGAYAEIVVQNVLASMIAGQTDASDLFPRLLLIIDLYPQTRDEFARLALQVPKWTMMRWIPQMTAMLGKPSGRAVLTVLEHIAKTYPNAVVFPLRISSEQLVFSSDSTITANHVARLQRLVESDVATFMVRELRRLTEPAHLFKEWLDYTEMLLGLTTPDRAQRLKLAFDEMYLYCCETSPLSCEGAREFARKHSKKILEECRSGEKLEGMTKQRLQVLLAYYAKEMAGKDFLPPGRAPLQYYSPWLSSFQLSENPDMVFEIPGQYDGMRQPAMDSDIVRVSSFDPVVLVMGSIRRPKRLTFVGTDEKEYPFLVKGGEDLRLDQRVEHTFRIMNGILGKSKRCAEARLDIRVYNVVPMTTTLGVLEWVDDTKPLRQCMADVDGFVQNNNEADAEYNTFLRKYMGRAKTIGEIYGNLFENANAEAVRDVMNKLWKKIDKAFLRTFMQKLAVSAEAYIALRGDFARSWASLSIASYVLGIGDRHTENFLVDLKSGRVIGIDFGHAFGTATEILPVPELVPFRLTRQIAQFMEPLGVPVLIEPAMVQVMSALREKHFAILAALDIFAKEPLMEWRKFAISQFKKSGKHIAHDWLSQRQGPGDNQSGSSGRSSELAFDDTSLSPPDWYPQQKIDIAQRKLRGEHPSLIMAVELERGHGIQRWHGHARDVLLGKSSNAVRWQAIQRDSDGADAQQSKRYDVNSQVKFLIDQASDPNILGRCWRGWLPWC
ncbi:hypothetical protein HK105_204071 [Polyrhizophydium stewartii]|uniref:DNA-dependent protein kinase catalytic subunit n=1 Tax=Polyrhizophydium stewartii TaxID=2732419 RepID=A0ABR4N9U9_9FUNG